MNETSPSDDRPITLPKQLHSLLAATEFPTERHHWNTNEEVAALLIAFDKHNEWQSLEAKQTPPSGSMLLYNRKKVRYRKDGYCWKKRKDGKTTREDHMKLKVQGVECIYGCYVHSALLPTFHRRCYWLLQNPNMVLVHYLNVPLTDENKVTIPSLLHCTEKKQWTKQELTDQLQPMFTSAGKSSSTEDQDFSLKMEEMIRSMVDQLLESQPRLTHASDCGCTNSGSCGHENCRNKCRNISPKTEPGAVPHGLAKSQYLQMLREKTLVLNAASSPSATVTPATTENSSNQINSNAPFILNLAQLQGSNRVIILSSQSASPISVINNSMTGMPTVVKGIHSMHPDQNNLQTANMQPFIQLQPNGQPGLATSQGHVVAPETLAAQLHVLQAPSESNNAIIHNIQPQLGLDTQVSFTAGTTEALQQQQQQQQQQQPQQQQQAPGQISAQLSIHAQDSVPHPQSICQQQLVGDQHQLQSQITRAPEARTTLTETNHNISLPLEGDSMSTDSANRCRFTTGKEVVDRNIGLSLGQRQGHVMNVNTSVQRMETSMEVMQPSTTQGIQYVNTNATSNSLASAQSKAVDDIVSQLNLKNELHNFGESNLPLSHDEIQKTLCGAANNQQTQVASSATHSSQQQQHHHQQQHTHSIESMDTMRSNMVSPHSSDLNFDAFDILDLPDFDTESLVVSETTTSNVGSKLPSVTASTTIAMTTSSSSNTVCSSCTSSSVSDQVKRESRAGIANITDFSPEWSYLDGGVKVLVTGPWYSTTSPYTILFDEISVSATLVQSGVLRCYCPGHAPGIVTLQVACEGYVISNTCSFEYKAKPVAVGADTQKDWFNETEDRLKLSVLEKLEEIEKRLGAGDVGLTTSTKKADASQNSFENRLMGYVRQLSARVWTHPNEHLRAHHKQMSLLHLVAALGYNHLLQMLIKWRCDRPCLLLESEVNTFSQDEQGCSPLIWACARGHLEAAVLLYQCNSAALTVCNKSGLLPLDVARMQGHGALADHLVTLHRAHLSVSSLPITGQSQTMDSMAVQTGRAGNKPVNKNKPSEVRNEWRPLDDLTIEIPPPLYSDPRLSNTDLPHSSQSTPTAHRGTHSCSTTPRVPCLLKRTSVEVLPGFKDCIEEGSTSEDDAPTNLVSQPEYNKESRSDLSLLETYWRSQNLMNPRQMQGLRSSNSDPHLPAAVAIAQTASAMTSQQNPMISMHDRDLNSPIMFMQTDNQPADGGAHRLSLGDVSQDTVAMETDSPRSCSPYMETDKDAMSLSVDEPDSAMSTAQLLNFIALAEGLGGPSHNQMMTLVNQIIAAMPERIKSSPAASNDLVSTEEEVRPPQRERSSSHSSFSSYSSAATPPCADDSGISTPLEGLAYDEYRYPDLGTPTSSLSPASSCLQSPYSITLDSPPPTAEEFTEYFNAPTTFMEKDFSQLTLSDQEQRYLYEAAKIIQNFYRQYKDKKQQAQKQRQKEIEAAILIQSYYRRYKQYTYYKKMTQAAVLIQSQFRSYYAQKRFKRSREAATVIQNQYRTYKEHERFKRSRNAAVIIQQRFRSHYQRKRSEQELARKMQQAISNSDPSTASDSTDAPQPSTDSIKTDVTSVSNESASVEKTDAPDSSKNDKADEAKNS